MKTRRAVAQPIPQPVRDERYDWLLGIAPVVAPLFAALLLRLLLLGQRPLSPDEGQVALAGWRLWRDNVLWLEQPPLLPNVLSALFGAFTAGDALARLPGALAGAALAALPLLLSPWIGGRAALASSWLLALSPLLVVSARTLTGGPVALLSLGLAVVAMFRGTQARVAERETEAGMGSATWKSAADAPTSSQALVLSGSARWAVLLGLSLAAGLGSSYLFIPWLVAAAAAAVLAWGRRTAVTSLAEWSADWRPLVAGLGAGVLVFDTRLLTTPSGLASGVVDPLWRWLPIYADGFESRLLALLATVEAPILLLAALSAWLVLRGQNTAIGRFLALWLVLTLALAASAQAPLVESLAAPLLPAAFLGGLGVAAVWSRVREALVWRVILLGAAGWLPVGYFLLASVAWTRQRETPPTTELLIAGIALGLIGLLASTWLNLEQIRMAGLLLAASVGLAVTLSFVGRFSLRHDEPPALPGHWAQLSLSEAVADVRMLARQRPDEPLTIQPDAAGWMGWSLRDVRLAPVEAGAPADIAFTEAAPARSTQSAQAGVAIPVGMRVDWADDASLRSWWRWVVHGENWVGIRAFGIIPRRS